MQGRSDVATTVEDNSWYNAADRPSDDLLLSEPIYEIPVDLQFQGDGGKSAVGQFDIGGQSRKDRPVAETFSADGQYLQEEMGLPPAGGAPLPFTSVAGPQEVYEAANEQVYGIARYFQRGEDLYVQWHPSEQPVICCELCLIVGHR